jgi:hypothetical protein
MTDLHKQALTLLAFLYVRHDRIKEAEILYQALYRLFPQEDDIAAGLAYTHLEQGRWDQALELATVPSRESGHRAAAMRLIRARALHGLGRHAEARIAVEAMPPLHPEAQ